MIGPWYGDSILLQGFTLFEYHVISKPIFNTFINKKNSTIQPCCTNQDLRVILDPSFSFYPILPPISIHIFALNISLQFTHFHPYAIYLAALNQATKIEPP